MAGLINITNTSMSFQNQSLQIHHRFMFVVETFLKHSLLPGRNVSLWKEYSYIILTTSLLYWQYVPQNRRNFISTFSFPKNQSDKWSCKHFAFNCIFFPSGVCLQMNVDWKGLAPKRNWGFKILNNMKDITLY